MILPKSVIRSLLICLVIYDNADVTITVGGWSGNLDGLNESGVKRPSNRHYVLYLVPDIVETRRQDVTNFVTLGRGPGIQFVGGRLDRQFDAIRSPNSR